MGSQLSPPPTRLRAPGAGPRVQATGPPRLGSRTLPPNPGLSGCLLRALAPPPTPIGWVASWAQRCEDPEKRSSPQKWALLRMLTRSPLRRSQRRAPPRNGARSRQPFGTARTGTGSFPRVQVGAGNGSPGCGGLRGLGRQVNACGCSGGGQRNCRLSVAGEGGSRCRRRPAGAR